jgi:hypothetical protein
VQEHWKLLDEAILKSLSDLVRVEARKLIDEGVLKAVSNPGIPPQDMNPTPSLICWSLLLEMIQEQLQPRLQQA